MKKIYYNSQTDSLILKNNTVENMVFNNMLKPTNPDNKELEDYAIYKSDIYMLEKHKLSNNKNLKEYLNLLEIYVKLYSKKFFKDYELITNYEIMDEFFKQVSMQSFCSNISLIMKYKNMIVLNVVIEEIEEMATTDLETNFIDVINCKYNCFDNSFECNDCFKYEQECENTHPIEDTFDIVYFFAKNKENNRIELFSINSDIDFYNTNEPAEYEDNIWNCFMSNAWLNFLNRKGNEVIMNELNNLLSEKKEAHKNIAKGFNKLEY